MWKRGRLIFLFLSNRKLINTPEKVYDFLSVNEHTDTHAHWITQTQTGCKTSVRRRGYEFSSLFHFHSPVSSFSRLSPTASTLSSLCFSSSLHCSFILFLIQAPSLFFPSHALTSAPFCSLRLLPQASCVYISVVYFYKCQTVLRPFVYWSRERKMGERGRAGRMGEPHQQGTEWIL